MMMQARLSTEAVALPHPAAHLAHHAPHARPTLRCATCHRPHLALHQNTATHAHFQRPPHISQSALLHTVQILHTPNNRSASRPCPTAPSLL